MWYQNIRSASFSFVTIHACHRQTDGRTDRITTPKIALAYARAVKTEKSVFEPPSGGLRGKVRTPSIALSELGKPVVDLLFVVIEFFRSLLRLRRYKHKSVEVGILRMEVGHFEPKFQIEGGVAHKPLLVSEN